MSTICNHYDINEQSISYSVDSNLPPIILECQPKLKSKETAAKLVTSFINFISNDFRKQYPNHTRPIGFDYWWQDTDGARLLGVVVKDIDLFVYLCDAKRYPTKFENISIIPDPPKRLPPQCTVVIKFVNNNIDMSELRDELKDRYRSTFTVENMLGGMRKILNSGISGIQGQLFDVDEYLPAPKILICTKCNIPGHTKKTCQASIEKCRRCGGDHKLCQIKCQHCDFRRRIVSELRQKPNCLPAQVQFFIPADCRPIGNSTRVLSNPILKTNEENYVPSGNKTSTTNAWPNLAATDVSSRLMQQMVDNQSTIDVKISDLTKDIAEMKQKYNDDQQKIEQRFQEQLSTLTIQQHKAAITIMNSLFSSNNV